MKLIWTFFRFVFVVLAGSVAAIRPLGDGTVELVIDVEGQSLKAHITARACEELNLAADSRVFAMIKSVALGDSSRR